MRDEIIDNAIIVEAVEVKVHMDQRVDLQLVHVFVQFHIPTKIIEIVHNHPGCKPCILRITRTISLLIRTNQILELLQLITVLA